METTAAAAALVVALGLAVAAAARHGLKLRRRRRRRARFLGRFLAPNVLRLLQERGPMDGMRPAAHDVTVVCCDLRGFTRYTQLHPPEYALELLRDYYRVVGRVATSFQATLKDFVGDGALILVGAPNPVRAHADVGLSMANLLRQDVERLLRRWSPRVGRLGIGLGVATGPVRAGVIASEARYEYVAVGSVVNVASHLCEAAAGGEILVAPCTAAQAAGWRERLQPGPELQLKGVEGTMRALRLVPGVPERRPRLSPPASPARAAAGP